MDVHTPILLDRCYNYHAHPLIGHRYNEYVYPHSIRSLL